jgi:lysophospholipase L1-like esterase
MKYIILFALSLVSALTVAQQPFTTNQRVFDTIPFIPDHTTERIALFEKEPVVTGKIIFLGNSITEGGNWAKLTGDNSIINRGIGGDITYGMLKRLNDVIKRKPSKLFILIGINDIGKDIPDEAIANNYVKIIKRVQAGSPETKIYVQSILPLNPAIPNFPQHYDKQDHVVHTNQLLREVVKLTNTQFINLFPLFLDDQQYLDKKYTFDGLHLNAQGYEVWVKYLKDTGTLEK